MADVIAKPKDVPICHMDAICEEGRIEMPGEQTNTSCHVEYSPRKSLTISVHGRADVEIRHCVSDVRTNYKERDSEPVKRRDSRAYRPHQQESSPKRSWPNTKSGRR
jgi:hypothetical protein